jgi:hypothetical protein
MRMITISRLLRVNHRLPALGGALLTSLALGGLALLPTAPAGAVPGPVRPLAGTASSLSPATLQAILSDTPLSSLNASELAELLAQQPGLSTLPSGPLIESLTSSIESLAGGGKTLGDLADPSELLGGVEASLGGLLSPLELLTLLEGNSLSSVLTSGLGTLTPAEMLAGLLGGAAQPEEMIGELLASVDQQALGELLGSTLTGAPFVKGTVGDLATQLGMTAEGFAGSLGMTTGQLPASTLALTAPLSNGRLLGVLNGAGGLALAVLTPPSEGEGGTGGGSGGEGGAGGTSGSGPGSSSGSGSPPTNTTLNLTTLTSVNNAPGTSPPSISAQRRHLRILSRWINGNHVTLLLEVPSAGSLVVRGFHLRTRRARVTHAGGLLERVHFTRLGIAALRRHRHHPRVRVLVMFFPKTGPYSSANTAMRPR